LRAQVYSAAGRLVDELAITRSTGGGAVEWDGRDAQGRECPSGIYVLRVAADEHEARQRLVLVR
ncbi:MAG TPA: FlgD immunoglobulin-like domain containing protein, partial [Candidatus Udaeobacter sp.]|nr:FlgD immunoglobulin-like domain containing protein [Candidatus Udaeobacter sp.]